MRTVRKLASVTLETLTPLHIGSGIKRSGIQEVLKINNRPYIPGSTLKGMFRSLYAFAQECSRLSYEEAEKEASLIFGSKENASLIDFCDLFSQKFTKMHTYDIEFLHRNGSTECLGRCELVDDEQHFIDKVAYWSDALPVALNKIMDKKIDITNKVLLNGVFESQLTDEGVKSEIGNLNEKFITQPTDNTYEIIWKLGKYAKGYMKGLSNAYNKKPRTLALIEKNNQKTALGWVNIKIDLNPTIDGTKAVFALNQW